MNCRKRAKSMIEQIVKEINICLENECFLSALGMALTLPDICGKAEYPTDGVTKRYIKWTNEYISAYEKDDSPYGIDMPYLSGEVLYNLRNAILHQGNPNIVSFEIKDIRCKVDEFNLVIGSTFSGDTSSVHYGNDQQIVYRRLDVNIVNLCTKLTRTAEGYYCENHEKFNFFNCTIDDRRKLGFINL